MSEINLEKFGAFISEKRKALGMTQKELAEKLFLSDKAVSKWERGLSLPDVSVLMPLAQVLGVTVAELLEGLPISGCLHRNGCHHTIMKTTSTCLWMGYST